MQAGGQFQTFVNNELPIGVPGDFAGANPRASSLAPPGGMVAGPAGLTVGVFGWADPATGQMSNYYKPNSILGFIHREFQALITTFLGVATTLIVPGHAVTPMVQGDYMALFAGGGSVEQKVYADPVTGACTAGAAGAGVTANSTAASLATTGILTVGATLTGTVAAGQAVTGAGIPEGSYVGLQLTGSAGSTGTYQLLNAVAGTVWPVVTSETVNFNGVIETPWKLGSNVKVNASVTGSIAANGVLTVTAVGSGVLQSGQFLSGTGIPANTMITAQLTATSPTTGGGTGTYATNAPSGLVVTSETIAATQGQIGKISSWG